MWEWPRRGRGIGQASGAAFGALGPIPVSSMRMLVATIVMLALVRPKLVGRPKGEWLGIVVYGLAMAAMNVCLYSAIDRIPMGVAVTLEFLGPCVVALAGSHHWREGLCAVVALVGEGLISFTPGGYFTGRLPVRAGLGRVLRPVHALRRPGRQDGRRARRARPVGHGRGAGHFAGIHRSRPACVGRPVGRHRRLGGAGSRDSLHDGHVVRAYHVGARGRHACSPSTPP